DIGWRRQARARLHGTLVAEPRRIEHRAEIDVRAAAAGDVVGEAPCRTRQLCLLRTTAERRRCAAGARIRFITGEAPRARGDASADLESDRVREPSACA